MNQYDKVGLFQVAELDLSVLLFSSISSCFGWLPAVSSEAPLIFVGLHVDEEGTSFCMAGDAAFPSTTSMITLLFSLLLAFHFAMAVSDRSLSTLASIKDGAKKKNTMVAASARGGSSQNLKTEITPEQTTEQDLLKGPKRGSSRGPRPPLKWQNKIFNANEHEVPSGPNPISNSVFYKVLVISAMWLLQVSALIPKRAFNRDFCHCIRHELWSREHRVAQQQLQVL
ncbi:hypothetical protein VNO80_20273 [Phaseolus coccineus]|uniref:Uncharacterized protein n=1 Tax=Phaseolus coccineus TaxID=3886 RepID=A0AAN9R101_PHACN